MCAFMFWGVGSKLTTFFGGIQLMCKRLLFSALVYFFLRPNFFFFSPPNIFPPAGKPWSRPGLLSSPKAPAANRRKPLTPSNNDFGLPTTMEQDYSSLIKQSGSLDEIDEWLFGPKSPKTPSPAADPSSTSKSPSVTVVGLVSEQSREPTSKDQAESDKKVKILLDYWLYVPKPKAIMSG